MAEGTLPTPERLRNLLRYDADSGKLYWLPRGIVKFDRRYAGKEALTAPHQMGYRVGKVDRFCLRAHRVAWAIHYGAWPQGEIDHCNGDKADNRIANLRDVPRGENALNMPKGKNNTSGVVGVSWKASRNLWVAYIKHEHKFRELGYFREFEDAVAARLAEQERLGFHVNHGR